MPLIPKILGFWGVLASVVAMSTVGCTKKDDAGRPAGLPPLENAPALAPPSAPPPPAPPPPAAEVPAPPDPGATITGEIVVPPAQRANVKPTDTIFLVARRISDNPTARGSLIAVKKLSAESFPIPFSLSAADMPFQNGAFDGELTLTVRADKDGDPMTHRKGDVFGALPKVRVGARGVRLALDQTQKEDESLAQPGAGMGAGMGMGTGMPTGMPPGHPALPPGHP